MKPIRIYFTSKQAAELFVKRFRAKDVSTVSRLNYLIHINEDSITHISDKVETPNGYEYGWDLPLKIPSPISGPYLYNKDPNTRPKYLVSIDQPKNFFKEDQNEKSIY